MRTTKALGLNCVKVPEDIVPADVVVVVLVSTGTWADVVWAVTRRIPRKARPLRLRMVVFIVLFLLLEPSGGRRFSNVACDSTKRHRPCQRE